MYVLKMRVKHEVYSEFLPFTKACQAAVQKLGVKRISVDRIREKTGSKELVMKISVELAMGGCWGKVVLLEGFPRNAAELKAFPHQPLLVLDFNSGLELTSTFVRSFYDVGKSLKAVSKLLQSCQPLQLSPPVMAVALLQSWMECAQRTPWWDFSFFLEAQPSYISYIKQQATLTANHYTVKPEYARPSNSPPAKAWLCWLTHQLNTQDYDQFCRQLDDHLLCLGPMPPPVCNSEDSEPAAWLGRDDAAAGISMDADALANVPRAFLAAFAAFEEVGLSPLSDPRICVFRATQTTSEAPDLTSSLFGVLNLFYRRFLILMGEAGIESLAGPAVELDWLWHAHMMHPLYPADCLRLFDRVLPHVPCKPGESDRIRSLPPDASRREMSELNKLLRSQLRVLAASVLLREALHWDVPKYSEDESAMALGCFLQGGDQKWLSERLKSAGGRLGTAFRESLQDPKAWTCPCPAQGALKGDGTFLNVTVRLMSGDTVLDQVMHKDKSVAELVAVLREQGETDDLKLLVEGAEVLASRRLGETAVAEGAVLHLVRIKRPPPLRTKRSSSSDDWYNLPCTCFTDFCQFHVLVSGNERTKFMRDLQEGDIVRTGSSAKWDRYRHVSRIWRCTTRGLSQTVQLQTGCRLTVSGH